MDTRLAWVTQSVSALYSLIDKDPFILQKIDAIPYIHTPLHESAKLGKTEMAMELMLLMPSFMYKLNTRGYSPLHLSVETNQVEISLELLKSDPNLVRLRGRGGVTPLHIVVEKGGVELLTEFLMASPKSIMDVNLRGETVLHLAVLNGRNEELRVITGWIQRMRQTESASMETDILNKRDREGNTALHVAANENKHLAVKSLLRCLALDRNLQNRDGLTSLDILRSNGQYMDKDTERLIKSCGGKTKASLAKVKTPAQFFRSSVTFWEFCSTTMIRYRSGISDGTRNALLVITTLIITATYQTALQPPTSKDIFSQDYIVDMVLWGFNTMAFWLALSFTLILLPLGRHYIWGYIMIAVPLLCSYGIAIYVNAMSNYLVTPILLMIAVLIGFPCYIIFIYVKWKRSLQMKKLKPKSEMILESFSTVV